MMSGSSLNIFLCSVLWRLMEEDLSRWLMLRYGLLCQIPVSERQCTGKQNNSTTLHDESYVFQKTGRVGCGE